MKIALLGLLAILILSGCIQTPTTGQAVLTQQEPETNYSPVVEVFEEPPVEEEPVFIEPTIEIPLVDPTPLVFTYDPCGYTLDGYVLEKEYRECYNDNYILKLKADTPAEFCLEIEDSYFLSRCLKELAWKKGDVQDSMKMKDSLCVKKSSQQN